MEGLGIAANVIAVVDLSAKIATICFQYSKDVKDAKNDIERVIRETTAFNKLANGVQDRLAGPHGATLSTSHILSGIFENAKLRLEELDEKLEPSRSRKAMRRFGVRALQWPFQSNDVEKALKDLARYTEAITLGLQIDSSQAISRIEDRTIQDRRREILSWLYPPQHMRADDVLQDILCRRHKGTGLWLNEFEPFCDWMKDEEPSLLWVTGLPGAGKSFLCAAMIEHLQATFIAPDQMTVHFFCSFAGQDGATTDHFLRSAAAQFASQSDRCLTIAMQRFEKKDGHPLRRQEYISLVESFICESNQVFIVVDGIDEIGNYRSEEKKSFVEILNQLLQQPARMSNTSPRPIKGKRKILITSREDSTVRSNLVEQSDSYVCDLESEYNNQLAADLRAFVFAELQRNLAARNLWLGSNELLAEIESRISETAVTILQAELHIRYVSDRRNDRDKLDALKCLPNTLDETYERILALITEMNPQRVAEVTHALQWLAVSAVPLTRKQLAEVVSIQPQDTRLDMSGICQPHDILAPISQLITHVIDHESLVSATQQHQVTGDATVQLRHLTVKNFLTGSAILNTSAKIFHSTKKESHAFAARACLQYLSFTDFSIDCEATGFSVQSLKERYSFLEYAATYWSKHLRLSGISSEAKCIDQLKHLLLWFTDCNSDPARFNTWRSILKLSSGLERERFKRYLDRDHPEFEFYSSSPLSYSIAEGLDALVDELLPCLEDVNQCFHDGNTCLFIAASANNVALVQRFLNMGADIDAPEVNKGLSPLHVAAEKGCDEMVAFLLEHGASPSVRSFSGSTPFYRAARNGSIKCLRLLYDAGSEVDATTWDLWTPLMEAVENNCSDAVKLLLDWGANAAQTSKFGSTPLLLARELPYHMHVDKDIVEALLKKGLETGESCTSMDE
ncbi:Ankyrin repeat protein [Colletotrichum higginsianum IMI 349063]|uniref:Ankyrin repeat protein n=3 Tax=Colletotrichum higginsianum (strain IMI 349063) TaxID=759273 RepID=A0A1B7XTJ7_COLHI|nr:Ankyrin repeat protein [Colletotrichum higginsianum IMI 349063]OBR03073.1 Ankyrin repeat protein [Colletotrichum higginsianum IMI 349063]